MKRESYSTLWGYGNREANANWSPFKSDEDAKKFRDALYYGLKKRGIKVKRSTLNGQMRPYWGWQEPCGHTCTVYELSYEVPGDNNV